MTKIRKVGSRDKSKRSFRFGCAGRSIWSAVGDCEKARAGTRIAPVVSRESAPAECGVDRSIRQIHRRDALCVVLNRARDLSVFCSGCPDRHIF